MSAPIHLGLGQSGVDSRRRVPFTLLEAYSYSYLHRRRPLPHLTSLLVSIARDLLSLLRLETRCHRLAQVPCIRRTGSFSSQRGWRHQATRQLETYSTQPRTWQLPQWKSLPALPPRVKGRTRSLKTWELRKQTRYGGEQGKGEA